jgi:two-component system sensor histidine kinase RegB
MGLGLFIAKTLLERSGADITFANAREPFEERARPGQPAGAVVECIWDRNGTAVESRPDRQPLGQNTAIEV